MEKISNVTFGKDSWSQASLPIRQGGLGLRSAADLSLPYFLSLFFACQGLINRLLPSFTLPHGEVINATDTWFTLHDSSPRQKETQSAWDGLACRDSLAALLDTSSPWNHCRLLTAKKSHTAAWSEAFPIASIGNLVSPDELQITIALRIGASNRIFSKARNAAVGSLLTGWGFTTFPALRMRAASPDIQP